MPTILINGQADSSHELLHSVAVDDHAGARLAVEHLLQLGHRAIGYLGTAEPAALERAAAGRVPQALAAAGMPPRCLAGRHCRRERGAPGGRCRRRPYALLPGLLEAGITAVFCYNDSIAIGALMACRAQGVAVPEELSVVGFDDIASSRAICCRR